MRILLEMLRNCRDFFSRNLGEKFKGIIIGEIFICSKFCLKIDQNLSIKNSQRISLEWAQYLPSLNVNDRRKSYSVFHALPKY